MNPTTPPTATPDPTSIPQPQVQTVTDLGQKAKAKYPGTYDDLADDELGRKIKAKYPGAYDDFQDSPAVPGMEKLGPARSSAGMPPLPGAAAPHLPSALQQDTRGTFRKIFDSPGEGLMEDIPHGIERMSEGTGRDIAGGASQVLEGGMKAATPFLPVSGVTTPLRTAAGLVSGAAAGYGTETGLTALGVAPEYARLGGDVAGIVGGVAGARVAPGAAMATGRALSSPGMPSKVRGAGWIIGGAGAAAAGHPVYGLAGIVKGTGDILSGIDKAKTGMAQELADRTGMPLDAAKRVIEDQRNRPNGGGGNRQAPAWSGMPQPVIPDLAPMESTPGTLPSGRTPGGINRQTPIQSTTSPTAPTQPSPPPTSAPGVDLDQIARSLGGKSFNKLDAKGRSYVQAIADRINNPQAQPSAPATGSGSPSPPPQGPVEGQGIPAPEAPEHVANRTALARDAARQLYATGITSDSLSAFMDDNNVWDKIAQATDISRKTPLGERRVSLTKPATRAETIKQLKALEISDKINQSLQQP